jgi:exodeoxyribonuclease-3
VKIITWNVNGVRAREREVIELVDKHAPDVLCMQEIKSSPEQLPPGLGGLMGLPAYASFWHGKGGYSGVSVHLRKSSFVERPSFSHPSFDHEMRVVEATCAGMSFVSMYVPNGGKDFPAKMNFLRELAVWADKRTSTIVCGDMNVARSDIDVTKEDRNPRTIGQRPDERELFERFFAAGFVDVGRKLAPDDDTLFTWWPYWDDARKRNVGWRLDLVSATPDLAAKARRAQVLRDFGTSDHAPVLVDFD